ncbi:TetR/AcrR family transcriptional regulator [Burkholderia aenigmatica]|uniref:TetR family transcriptional regulator n=1 Tax=Burkholderia aenigmatica TaxID=2015348 RepID=A0A228HTK5_9BURK|nr:TetR/AcrR family transcriptional regulator [Burkholderia aenigmatica]OXI33523.1 TetR family transcriptional regulator [Burkholderia aenigmatica]
MQQTALEQGTLDDLEEVSPDTRPISRRNPKLRYAQIILAAQQTFQEEGYAGFATRRVASRVGITLANVQHYFRTKEELLRTALLTYLRQMISDYTAIASQSGVGAARRCSALIDRIFHDINETDLPKFLFEVWALAQHEQYAAELVDEMYAEYRSIFAKLLSEIHPALTSEQCLVRACALVVQTTGMMFSADRATDSDKDYTAFVRATRRAAKMVVCLSPQDLEQDASRHNCHERHLDETSGAHIRVFGSAEHVQHGLFELSTRHTAQDALDYRATVQGKRREVKINEILTSAANLLAEEGYANFSLARVARKLGIPPSALQNYFPTHDDLLRSTIGALLTAYLDRYADMGRPTGKPALERLREIVDDAFEEARDSRVCRFLCEITALSQHSDIALELVKKVYSAYRAIYVDLVREIDSSATARECHARATLIAAQMEGATVLTFGSSKQLLDTGRVFEMLRAITIRIAHGRFSAKDLV